MKALSPVLLLMLLLAGAASADTLTFTCISHNNASNCLTGETYLRVDVIGNPDTFDFGSGQVGQPTENQVLFRFYLAEGFVGPMSITDVYFDDGSLLGISTILETAGVSFASPANPSDLPSGSNADPPFVTTDSFSADSTSPHLEQNGVNALAESLGILFNLKDSQTFTNVMDELGTGDLRIGVHVQGFANGGSEAFITGGGGPPELVPEPGALTLFAIGAALIAAGRFYRRTRLH